MSPEAHAALELICDLEKLKAKAAPKKKYPPDHRVWRVLTVLHRAQRLAMEEVARP